MSGAGLPPSSARPEDVGEDRCDGSSPTLSLPGQPPCTGLRTHDRLGRGPFVAQNARALGGEEDGLCGYGDALNPSASRFTFRSARPHPHAIPQQVRVSRWSPCERRHVLTGLSASRRIGASAALPSMRRSPVSCAEQAHRAPTVSPAARRPRHFVPAPVAGDDRMAVHVTGTPAGSDFIRTFG